MLQNRVQIAFQQCIDPHLKNASFVVAVSGGLDSIVLLHTLHAILHNNQLIVAHLNHNIRQEADEDRLFVADLAGLYQIQFVSQQVNVPQIAREQNLTIEEAGRQARYDFFAAVAERYETAVIVTAHHANDQAETVLMRLLRGSGLDGLGSMQMLSPFPGHPQLLLFRPLLNSTRTDIEAYAKEHQLSYREDHTNQDQTYLRNRIRHELLPLLQTYNSGIEHHLLQLAQMAQADYETLQALLDTKWPTLVHSQGTGWLALNRQTWQMEPVSMQRMAIRRALQMKRPFLPDIHFQLVEDIRTLANQPTTGGQLDLPNGLVFQVGYDRLLFKEKGITLPITNPQLLAADKVTPLPIPGNIQLANGWALAVSECIMKDETVTGNADRWSCYIPLSMTPLFIRGRLPGETFQPLGMEGQSTKVKKMMIDRKIPREERPLWPIVANNQHLIWIVGHHQDHRSRVIDPEQRILKLSCIPPAG